MLVKHMWPQICIVMKIACKNAFNYVKLLANMCVLGKNAYRKCISGEMHTGRHTNIYADFYLFLNANVCGNVQTKLKIGENEDRRETDSPLSPNM